MEFGPVSMDRHESEIDKWNIEKRKSESYTRWVGG